MSRGEQHKMSITNKILVGMALGLLLGSLLNVFASENEFIQDYLVQGLFHAIGKMFVNALKMLVVPLVVFSLICGVCGIGDIGILGRVGLRAFLLYLMTTAMAVSLALIVAISVGLGKDGGLALAQNAQFEVQQAPPLTDVFINIIPDNPIHALANGEMLPIIFFVILFAIAMLMSGDAGKRLAIAAEQLNEVMMVVVTLVMDFAPIGVFCLMAKTFAEQGIGLILPMIGYFGVVLVCLLLHALGTLNILLFTMSRLSPFAFLSNIRPAQIFAFSTASSNATIPVTLRALEKRMGVHNAIASFTVPFGATINMDGTAIMQGVATVFIANVYGIGLGMADYLTIIAMSVLASIGTAGVPGVGLIMLAMVFNQVGLPVEGIGLILGVDRLLDMARTAVNVTGDAIVTCIVAHGENQLDRKVFYDPDAGVITEVELPHRR
ncbi:MAG: dicarboxylate/amino acid:cation symporter [Gammaproteobacteria bacterium]